MYTSLRILEFEIAISMQNKKIKKSLFQVSEFVLNLIIYTICNVNLKANKSTDLVSLDINVVFTNL